MTAADVRVCVFGDSFTAGVGDPTGAGWLGPVGSAARAAGHLLTVYGLGVRRNTSVDIARRWLEEASRRLQDVDRSGVVFAFGTNDVDEQGGRRRVARDRTLALLAGMLDDAHGADWPALVIGPPPVLDAPARARAADLTAGMAGVCADRGVPFVDLGGLQEDPVWAVEIAAGDAFHPSTDGYVRLAALIEPAFVDWVAGLSGAPATVCRPASPP